MKTSLVLLTATFAITLLAGCTGGGGGGETSGVTEDPGSDSTTTSWPTTSSDTGPTSTPAAITIANATEGTVVVRAGIELPFKILNSDTAGEETISAECPCTVCGTNKGCYAMDWLASVVTIPIGQSITLDDPISRFLLQPYDPATCIELGTTQDNTCFEPHAFPVGDYILQVDYDSDLILQDQPFEKGSTQWGQQVWAAQAFIPLTKHVSKNIHISGAPIVEQITLE
ncbi:MAG: hypothetical protein U0441_21990 [Polyangiaceae bacterium]